MLNCLSTAGKLDVKVDFSLQHPLLAIVLMDIYGHSLAGTLQK